MDGRIFRWINRLADRTGWAHGIFRANANYGIVVFALLLLAAYIDGRHHHDLRAVASSVWAGAATLIALGIGQIIGNAVDRARPYESMTGVHLLVDRTTDFSFPSDHATAAGAVAAGLLIANRRWGLAAAALALIMAFTRVYVGAHYPGDVVVGLALGAAIAGGTGLVVVPVLARLASRIDPTRFGIVVSRRSAATPPA
ncbi:MAG: phosphatase PAP2 family protein [Ilumatobacteraceae bacterium]